MVDPRVRPLEGIKVYPTFLIPLKKEEDNRPGLQTQIQLSGPRKIDPPDGYRRIRLTRAAQYVLNLIKQDAIRTGNGTPKLENLAHRLLEITRGSDTKVSEITSKLNFEGVKQLLGVQDKRQQEAGIKNKFYNFDTAFNSKTNLLIQEELIEKIPELTGEIKDVVSLAGRYRNDSVVGIGGLLQALCETCEANGNKDKRASAVLSALGITKDRVSSELKKLDDIDLPHFQFLENNKNINPKGFLYPASHSLYLNTCSKSTYDRENLWKGGFELFNNNAKI